MEKHLKALWNHGGSMFATFWIVIALYALGGYLVWAFLQLDAQFSRPLAGGVVPESVTQQIAWGIRAFSVIAGSLAIYFTAHSMKGWSRAFTGLTIFAAVLLLVHAFGVSAKIMQKQYSAVSSISQVAAVDVGSIDDEISDLVSERDGLPTLTESTVSTYQRSIDSIVNDGLDNDDQAVALAQKQQEAIAARDERLGEIRARLIVLRGEKRDVQSGEVTENAATSSFNDLFIFGARLSDNKWNPAEDPSDTHKFIWGVAFFTFWFGFGEVLMMVCFTGGYAVLKLRSVQQIDEKDPVRVEAGKKAAETRKRKNRRTLKVRHQAEGYWKQFQHALRLAKSTEYTAEGIASTAFIVKNTDGSKRKYNAKQMDSALQMMLNAKLISDEDYRLIMRLDKNLPAVTNPNAVDVINPDPTTLNGSAEPIDGESEDDDTDASGPAVN